MKKIIKNKEKMKNTMYIVFGVFALALFTITRANQSYASDGLILDKALDAIAQGTTSYESLTENNDPEVIQENEEQLEMAIGEGNEGGEEDNQNLDEITSDKEEIKSGEDINETNKDQEEFLENNEESEYEKINNNNIINENDEENNKEENEIIIEENEWDGMYGDFKIEKEDNNKEIMDAVKTAILLPGLEFSKMIKGLAKGQIVTDNYSSDVLIIDILSGAVPDNLKNDEHKISSSSSEYPIYAYFDNGIIYYDAEGADIYLNEDSSYMFYGLTKLTSLDLSNFDTSNVTNMNRMFYNCNSLASFNFSNFDTSKVTNMAGMFGWTKAETLDLSNFNTSNVTDMSYMFHYSKLTSLDLSNFNTSNVTNMNSMFASSKELTSLDLSSFDTRNVTDMNSMFSFCQSLIELDLSNFDTKNVTDIGAMFKACSNLENITFGPKFTVDKVTVMYSVFFTCYKLKELDLSNWNTKSVTRMNDMFGNCNDLKRLDLSSFDTTNVTNMNSMFEQCDNLEEIQFGENFDTSNVTDMNYMFGYCQKLKSLDLTTFNTSNVTNMSHMFQYDKELSVVYVSDKFITTNTSRSDSMLSVVNSLIGGNGTVYNSSKTDKEYARIDNAPDEPGYFTHGIRLKFDSMSGTIIKSQTIKKGLTGNKPNNPTRTGYLFSGWYEDGAIDVFDFTGTQMNQDITLFAKWKANTYTVSFNADNGETNPENITVTYDSQYPMLPVVNKTGYTFLGWYNEDIEVMSGDVVNITENITLNAKRIINMYKINFDTDGGNEINSIERGYSGSLIGITLPTPVKECNDFLGWNAELPELMPAHDITLKAIWNYTCSRASGGGGSKKSEPTTSEVTNDTTQEHNSADDNTTKQSDTTTAPINEETTKEVISVTQEVADDGTEVEVVVEAVAIKNTNIVATVRTETPVNGVSSYTSSSSSSTTHTKEQTDAYSFAKANGITTTESIETAKMNTELTRIQMAKMLSNFAINVLGEEPDVSKGTADFDDVTNKMDEQYDNAVTKAYQLGIMGQNVKDNEFRPNDEVSRAEFTASLSRLLYKTDEGEYKGTSKYYIPHIVKLYNEGIVNKADPKIKEKRGYVMTMLKRTVE